MTYVRARGCETLTTLRLNNGTPTLVLCFCVGCQEVAYLLSVFSLTRSFSVVLQVEVSNGACGGANSPNKQLNKGEKQNSQFILFEIYVLCYFY